MRKTRVRTGSGGASPGCLVAFAVPFAAFGAFALLSGLRKLLGSSPEPSEAWGLLLFGGLFAGVGIALIAFGLKGRRGAAERARQSENHPNEPWLRRPDWASGRIQARTTAGAAFLWIVAVFWNAISTFAVVALWKEAQRTESKAIGWVLLFPAAGILLLYLAIRATIALRKYGTPAFELARVPGAIGRRIQGTILAKVPARPEEGFLLRLRCVRNHVTGSGKNRSHHVSVLWSEEARVPPARAGGFGDMVSIPVSIRIPPECRPTDESDPDDRIQWYLEATAEVPGVDFRAEFEVPVFRTGEPPESEEEMTASEKAEHEEEIAAAARSTRVRVGPTPAGGIEFLVPARESGGTGTGCVVLLLAWFGGIVALLYFGAPHVLAAVASLLGALFLAGTLWVLFGTWRVTVEDREVRVTWDLLGLGRTRSVPCPEVREVRAEVGLQSGGRTGTPSWVVKIVTMRGETIRASADFRAKREAEWLAGEIEGAIRPWKS